MSNKILTDSPVETTIKSGCNIKSNKVNNLNKKSNQWMNSSKSTEKKICKLTFFPQENLKW